MSSSLIKIQEIFLVIKSTSSSSSQSREKSSGGNRPPSFIRTFNDVLDEIQNEQNNQAPALCY
jgi:flagellar hook-basal body complex protein FliE